MNRTLKQNKPFPSTGTASVRIRLGSGRPLFATPLRARTSHGRVQDPRLLLRPTSRRQEANCQLQSGRRLGIPGQGGVRGRGCPPRAPDRGPTGRRTPPTPGEGPSGTREASGQDPDEAVDLSPESFGVPGAVSFQVHEEAF